MILNPLNLISAGIKSVGEYLGNRQKIKAAVDERKDELKKLDLEARIKTEVAGVESDIKLDSESRDAAGWMDDISFYIFLAPAVLAFFPNMVNHVKNGFAVLSEMPEWYQYALGMMLISVWGYRKLVSPLIQAIVKAWLGKV